MKPKQFITLALSIVIVFAVIGCKQEPQPVEKSYLVPNTKVTIKYMGLASDTSIPAEISKLAEILSQYTAVYSNYDRTIYVIDGSSSGPEIQNNGTMKIGRKYVINTPNDDIDDAIYPMNSQWLK